MPTSHYEGLRQTIEAVVKGICEGYKPPKVQSNKVIRDSVFGFNVFFKHEIDLLDSPLLQRLRRIHQTSLAHLTYPSSVHTRFEHSLGVTIIADKMIGAINSKLPQGKFQIEPSERAEIRLACLLHDSGHGPFSHASESVFGSEDYEIDKVKAEQPALFGNANPHEVVSYCIATSDAFRKHLWGKICELYNAKEDEILCDLDKINLERVGQMILGKKAKDYPLFLSQIVNGPFDADKFDYIIRDGHFTGLVTPVDIERLFVSLDIAKAKEHGLPEFKEDVLCMDIGGATVLEQVLFSKMILTSSFYHHHKVRSAFRTLVRLFESLRENKCSLNGVTLDKTPNFLMLDDTVILGADIRQLPDESARLLAAIRNRRLPKRALVITKDSIMDGGSMAEYFRIRDDRNLRMKLERSLASALKGISPVFIDFPPEASFAISGVHSLVRLAPKRFVNLDRLYPASGWVTGYAEYRYRGYVFSPPENQKDVCDAAVAVFDGANVKLNKELCAQLAKMPTRQ